MIPQETEEDLVRVIRQCGQGQLVSERLGELYKERGGWDRVAHVGVVYRGRRDRGRGSAEVTVAGS